VPAIPSSSAFSENVVQPTREEAPGLERLSERIEEIYHEKGKALLIGPNPDEEPVELPASAFRALKSVAEAMAKGQTIALMPYGLHLTTQQAADLLHVSRPHVVKLCDAGELPFEWVGTHRRIRIEDLIAYRERRALSRKEHLRELTRSSQEIEGGYRRPDGSIAVAQAQLARD
jgi:excisionase family DNA binding protein